jgi:hypothetical protein
MAMIDQIFGVRGKIPLRRSVIRDPLVPGEASIDAQNLMA